jgi:methionyl-tRNA synthetase
MLLALDIPLPRGVFAHGWWTSQGQKMSKSLGNFVSQDVIREICAEYSRDVYRYFVLREVPFGADGDFSRAALQLRYNTELANDIGNLLSRTVNMIGRYFDATVPTPQSKTPDGPEGQFLLSAVTKLAQESPGLMAHCQFSQYLQLVVDLASATNRYIEVTSPFTLAKDPSQRERLGTIMYCCGEAVRIVLSSLEPFMPEKAVEGLTMLGLDAAWKAPLNQRLQWGGLEPGKPVAKGSPLFPRKV